MMDNNEKRRRNLISKYDTIEKIYNSIDSIENPRLKKLLIDSEKNAYLSKKLVTIDCDVDINFNLSEMSIDKLYISNMIIELNKLDIHAFDKLNQKHNNYDSNR